MPGNLFQDIPDTVCLHNVRTGERLDYAAFANRVDASTNELKQRSLGKAERVVIGCADPIKCLSNLFAAWNNELCAVLVTPSLSEDEKDRVERKTAPVLWIDDDGVRTCAVREAHEAEFPDAALILMTSGTTGDPKGIVHSQETLRRRLELNVAEIGADTLRDTLCTLPLFFGHGLIGNCLTPMRAGKALHLLPSPTLAEIQVFSEIIDQNRISFFSSVPSLWRMILKLSPPPESSPARVHIGSAPLSVSLWQEVVDWCGTSEVFNAFGMTETANWMSGGRLEDQEKAEGYVGKPWGGEFRVYIDGELKGAGTGEVAVNTPSLMLGYWRDPEKNREIMVEGFMLTGDVGELDDQQSLRLIGRNKHEINRGGIKILAEEIDMLLERHPLVSEACGFGIPDEISGEFVGAVVTSNAAELTSGDLLNWCRSNARHEAVPHRLEIVSEIPKNDRGKVVRSAVQKLMVEQWG